MEFLQHITEGQLLVGVALLIILILVLFLIADSFSQKKKDSEKTILNEMLAQRAKTVESEPIAIKESTTYIDPVAYQAHKDKVAAEQEKMKPIKDEMLAAQAKDIAEKKVTKKKSKKKTVRKKVARKSLEAKILTYFEKQGDNVVDAKTVNRYFRQFSNATVYSNLSKLVKKGDLKRVSKGQYQKA